MSSRSILTSCRCFLLLALCTRLQLLKRLLVSRLAPLTGVLFELNLCYIILIFPVTPLQALIQFTDAETASSARNALDGRSIPKYDFNISIFMDFTEILGLSDIYHVFLTLSCDVISQVSPSRAC